MPMRNSIRLFLALVMSSVAGAHAQELLTTDDGISLRGTVRLLQSNAATCNVLKANEPSYEEMRVNQDQPLHLWELEFSVFNGSGRALDHLIAYYDIDSPWPPCTNWTENYRLGAEHDFVQVQWVGPSGRIQHTGAGMPTLPNQAHSETILLLAFNGVRPEFTEWSVNYTFMEGDAATAAPAVALATPQQAASDSAAPLSGTGQEIDFGDDSGNYPNDGECDDPRFERPGAYSGPLEEDVFRDASDCLAQFDSGQVWLLGEGPELFGALAVGDELGYGGVVSATTQAEADYDAMNECGSVDSDCEIVACFGADTCVAVARDDEAGWIGWATGPDSQETNDAAISECMAGGGSSCAAGDFACNGATASVAATDSAERTRFAYAIGETGATDDQFDVCNYVDTIFVYWCWSELQSHPGCFFWVDEWMELRDAMATWTGQCVDGKTNGNGTLAWTLSVGAYTFTGGFAARTADIGWNGEAISHQKVLSLTAGHMGLGLLVMQTVAVLK